jgi:undecaprenol kinase/diacylglycerol kinase (ATP)
MKSQKFSISSRICSFGYALNGLKILFKEEPNARIQLLLATVVIIAGFVFKISLTEWIAIVFAIGFVLAMEAINSAIEGIADFVSPQKHGMIKKIKDLSAAGVFISAITALVIGLIVFLPKVLLLFSLIAILENI